MPTASSNNKRIAKNTLLLYFRMLFLMAVSLYTSRVILDTLGVEDFGIYNVVGGVVSMMGILNGAMSVSTQRYLTFELGKGDETRLKQVFSMCFTIYLLLSLILVLLAETIGLWFLNNKMMIPEERLVAANWVYQFSILACVNSLLTNPYNAVIIAHEKMNVYAYVSILDALLRLGAVYCVMLFPTDPLILYAGLIMLAAMIVTAVYRVYCIKNYREASYSFFWEKDLFIQLISYSGWNLFGSIAGIVKGQGLNILLNLFFNPAVNAARGIAFQINSAITQFSNNFYTAVRPQITKFYAQDDFENMFKLVIRSSKLTFFLLLLISLPVLIETPFFVKLWLGQLPEYVVIFTRLIVVISAIDSMASPLMTSCHATGNIKMYQSVVGTMIMMNIPISYIALKYLNATPAVVFGISLVISFLAYLTRVGIVKTLIPTFPVLSFLKESLLRTGAIACCASFFPILFHNLVKQDSLTAIINIGICCTSSTAFIWLLGLTKGEREAVTTAIKKKLKIG